MRVLLILLVLWTVVALIGFTFDSLQWLGVVGLVLGFATSLYGIFRGRSRILRR
jgi:hypothetical protein